MSGETAGGYVPLWRQTYRRFMLLFRIPVMIVQVGVSMFFNVLLDKYESQKSLYTASLVKNRQGETWCSKQDLFTPKVDI
jgi:hypothetical protein